MAEKNTPTLSCVACKTAFPPYLYNPDSAKPCVKCGALFETTVFPAMFRVQEAGLSPEALAIESESSCFYHTNKKAATVCENCGRFLCSLCDVTIADRHICPACIESGEKKDKIPHLKKNRILYDDLALSIAVLPLLIFYFTIISAPITLYISIRYWNAPSSVIPRTKIRFVIAIIVALLQIAGWIALIWYLVAK